MEKQKMCPVCMGEGYVTISDTVLLEDNESITCQYCDGAGVVELEAADIF